MKKNILFYGLSVFCLAIASVGCSNSEIEDAVVNEENIGGYTYKLHLNCELEGEGMTRVSYDWNVNDEVIIAFSDDIEGKATFDGADWIITSNQAIPVKTSDSECVAAYVQKGNQIAECLPYMGTGKYTHASSEDDVYVNVELNPQTFRLRFSGANGTTIKLNSNENDIEYYSSYSNKEFFYKRSDVLLTVTNGYTPYIYGKVVDGNINEKNNTITIENNGKKYTRKLGWLDIPEGMSAVLTIPTEENYLDFGWEKVQ